MALFPSPNHFSAEGARCTRIEAIVLEMSSFVAFNGTMPPLKTAALKLKRPMHIVNAIGPRVVLSSFILMITIHM